MSYLFNGESARSREETEKALREAKFTPEDFEPRISDWFGIPYGLDDFRPMIGDFLIVIVLMWLFVKTKDLFLKPNKDKGLMKKKERTFLQNILLASVVIFFIMPIFMYVSIEIFNPLAVGFILIGFVIMDLIAENSQSFFENSYSDEVPKEENIKEKDELMLINHDLPALSLEEAFQLKNPVQRIGFVLICIGFTIVIICFIYDMVYSYPRNLGRFFINMFDEWKRHYYFRYVIAWYGLIIIFIGAFLIWIHEHTTALLWKWIKHGN